jgi:hypothetical protein
MTNDAVMRRQAPGEFEAAKKFVRDTFYNWIIKSIEVAFRATSESERNGQGGTPLVAFLLLSCAIDTIAGFYAGRTSKHGTSGHYKSFIKKYMPRYSPENMYERLRCALAHNFAVDKGLALTHGRPHLHNVRDLTGDTVFKNFEDLFADFKAGLEQYFSDLESSDELKSKFTKRLEKFGLASRVEFKHVIAPTSLIDVTALPATGAVLQPPKSQAKN